MPHVSSQRIAAPVIATHGDELARLLADVFHENPAPETVARIRRSADIPGWLRPQDSRIGQLDGRIVTSVSVFRYLTRIGGARLVTAGIGAVATHREYRKRGLMRETFNDMVAGLRPAGYDISLLFGIPDFYWQFGYVRAWNEDTITVRAENLRPGRPAPATESCAGPELSGELVACMNRWLDGRDGSAVRPTRGGVNKLQGETILALAWRDNAERLDGAVFLKIEESRVVVADACGEAETVVAVVARVCAEQGRAEAVFPHLSYRSPLSRRLRLGDCQMARNCRRNGGALARVVNLHSCLEKLAPDLAGRLAVSRLHDWRGRLVIGDGREEVGLDIAPGAVRIVPAGATPHRFEAGDHAASLIFGAEDPLDTLARPGVVAGGDAAELAAALFPELGPQLPELDRY